MAVVAIGAMRLDVRSQVFHFQKHTADALDEARIAPGCLHADASQDGKLMFSLSVWRDEASMQAFVTMPAHARAMRRLPRYGTSLGFLAYPSEVIPTWEQAIAAWKIHAS